LHPSLRILGPSAAVVSRDFFLQTLRSSEFKPVWVVAGEKNVGSFIESLAPTPEQLRALFKTK